MKRQIVLLSLALGLASSLFGAPLEAKTFALPEGRGALITVKSPDGWTSELDDGTLTIEDPNSQALAFCMVWEVDSDQKAIQGAKEVIGAGAAKVRYGEPRRVRANGLDALELEATGVIQEDNTPLKIRAMIFKLPGGQRGLVLAIVNSDAGKRVSETVAGIFQSVKAAAAGGEGAPVVADTAAGRRPGAPSVAEGLVDIVRQATQGGSAAGDHGQGGPKTPPPQDTPAPAGKEKPDASKPEPALGPGHWRVVTETNDVIYSSFLIATATLRLDSDPDPLVLGDQMGMVGAEIEAPRDNCPVEVEVSSPDYIKVSRFVGTLPKAGQTYGVWPVLKYDYDRLLALRQTVPETMTVKVSLDGKPAGEESLRMQIRPINEVLFGFEDEDGVTDMSWTFAAFVNENHPFIDEILREALNLGIVTSFAGYQKDPKGVREEIRAVWQALKKRGFRYSNITTTSSGEDAVYTQHVRLMGDALKTAQANCVDGTVLLASILRKIGLKVYLVAVPGHMFLAVDLDEDGEDTIGIETTLLDDSTFAEAVRAGNAQIAEAGDKFNDEDDLDYQMIDIEAARKMGVIPIRDMVSEGPSRAGR